MPARLSFASEGWQTWQETMTSSPTWPGTTYAYGDCAPALRTWQLRMNTFGFGFEGTGCYYDKTKTAVQALQAANNLTQDGQIGADTWRAAWEGKAPPKP